MQDVLLPKNCVKGRVRSYIVQSSDFTDRMCGGAVANLFAGRKLPGKWTQPSAWGHNDVLYDWAAIVSRLLAEGDNKYRINGIYLEYKNLASASTVVTPPAFSRAGGISYYNGLSGSPDVDYLRVPLVAATRSSSDASLFPDGNVITFFTMSQGVTGAHGKAFSDVNNSKVYGGALVAIPDLADRTKDLIFSRFYFSSGSQQQVKLPTSQIGLEWQITLD